MKAKAKDVLRSCHRFIRTGQAVSALEYAILVGVIVAAVAGALITFADNMEAGMKVIGDKVKLPTNVKSPDLGG